MRCLLAPALVAVVALGCGQQAVETVETSPTSASDAVTLVFNEAGAPTVDFDVPNMHCEAMCVPKVRATLESQPGVVDVKVDLETKVATVAVEEGAFDADAAIEALAAADFPESALRSDGPALIAPTEQPAGDSAIEEAEQVESAG